MTTGTVPDYLPPVSRDVLMPMHLLVDQTGLIRHLGPTLARVGEVSKALGRSFFEVFEIRRPHGIGDFPGLLGQAGTRLRLTCRGDNTLHFKGVAVPTESGVVLNMSFGVSLVDAIRRHDLRSRDFAPTDLTIEMLYLLEAKTTILGEWRRLNTRLQSARAAAEHQAFTDTLTGLGNRRALDHVLEQLVADGVPFGLVNLDLDHFKRVNDTYGHAAGDHVLKTAARAMIDATRAQDTLARAGGDEFVLVLPDLIDLAALKDLTTRLIARLEVPIAYEGHTCRISGSAGITVSEGGGARPLEKLLEQADLALYASKNGGRGRATIFCDTST